ncbi:MAG: ABC transporter permease [Pyrinomonadaceae bacterium]
MNILQDARHSCRALIKAKSFSAVTILVLALGIGSNVAIFSLINSILLRPLPYHDPDQLVMIWGNFRSLNMMRLGASAPEFQDYKNQNHVFTSLAAFQRAPFNLTGVTEPQRLNGARVTGELFTMLGVPPLAGRSIIGGDDSAGHEHVAVLSNRLWRTRFNSDSTLIGRNINLDGLAYVVVGIMPRDFQFPFAANEPDRVDVWVPAVFSAAELNERSRYNYQVLGRLKPGVTISQAAVEMERVGGVLEQQYPRSYRGPKGEPGGWQITLTSLQSEVVGNIRPLLFVLLGVVIVLLLIVCANVANLSLARASTRSREIAIRAALGATRRQLVRQLLIESLLLSAGGGLLGLLLAAAGVDLLMAAGPRDIPRLNEVSLDSRILIFTFGLSLINALLFGIVPALSNSRVINDPLKEGSKSLTALRGQRLRSALVIGEIAAALVLLVAAGLIFKSFARLSGVNPGFNSNRVLTARMWLASSRYEDNSAKLQFFDQLLAGVKALPGVESASLTTALPMTGATFGAPFSIEGRPFDPTGVPPHAYIRTIAPDYFRSLGIPLVQGRDFDAHDTGTSTPVVVINETFARGFFAGNPIGKRFKIGGPQSPRPLMQVAGVVHDVKADGLDAPTIPEMYLPLAQNGGPAMTLVVRTAGDPLATIPAIRSRAFTLDNDLPVYDITTMRELLNASVAPRRFNMFLISGFAFCSLILATLGIFSVIAYSVAQRTHELGIRIALGARTTDVLRLVLGQGARLILTGVGAGLVAALGLTRVLRTFLFETSPTDPLTYLAISFLLVVVALIACYVPARRAAQLDPLIALRSD